MKLFTLLAGIITTLTAAQTPSPYTDAKSSITFNTFQYTSGYFFGIALPDDPTGNTDFIATLGGRRTGWSGISLLGPMRNALLVVAWPNSQKVVGSFRKTAEVFPYQYGPPPVTTGNFTQIPIANGTYVNSTHWPYSFLCSRCIQSDKTTFAATQNSTNFGYAFNSAAPSQAANDSSPVSRHTEQGLVMFDLVKARSKDFDTWKTWAAPKVEHQFQG